MARTEGKGQKDNQDQVSKRGAGTRCSPASARGADGGGASRPHLEGLQTRRRAGEGWCSSERDLERTRADEQGRIEAGDKAGEERTDRTREGAGGGKVDVQADPSAIPHRHGLDRESSLHRLPVR